MNFFKKINSKSTRILLLLEQIVNVFEIDMRIKQSKRDYVNIVLLVPLKVNCLMSNHSLID
jgi:hypothetical protein